MSRVLAYTSPARGHLFPLTPVLDELAARGHHVTVRTLASQVPLLRSRGLDAAPISPDVEAVAMDDYRAGNVRAALAASTSTFCTRAAFDAPDLRRAIDETQPDAVVVDINSWGAMAVAEAWGGPWAAFCPYPIPLGSVDAPPFGPGLPPARGTLGRLRDRLLRPVVLGTVTKAILPPVNEVRARAGLAPLREADEMFRRPPLLLYATAEPFEYPRRDWPPNVVMVGPLAWDPPAEQPPWLADVAGPVVLVTTSSEFQDDGRLVRTAFEALADEPVTVVATLPASEVPELRVPSNARVERFLPHSAVLDRAACAITHGGMGATQKALSHGVPVCAVPFGRDQHEVARRVEVAGAGTRLPARRLDAGRLRRAVRQAVDMRAGAERVAAAFAGAGGAPAAADALERRLTGTPAR
jgi:MGT family glycosyltransferase